MVYENDLYNLNGGDGRFDKSYPSYSGLSPLYRKVGKYYQVYSSNSNENLYTNLWTGPFSGFTDVIQTFKNTKTPHLMKPINIYYHFYSGEHEASINALKEIYEFSLKEEIAPIFVSDYFKIIHGFINAKIEKLNEKHFKVSNNSSARTIRFINSSLVPDYSKSKNITGHSMINDFLYVYLGDKDESEIVLTEELSDESIFVTKSNGWINSVELKDKSLVIKGTSRVPLKGEVKVKGKVVTFSSDKKNDQSLEVAL